MERFLSRSISSLLEQSVLSDIEVIVVNDGSSDATSTAAHQFEARFPETVNVIDKANGNYGSTINVALPLAKGKYVKILDADDWFDIVVLKEFVSSLKQTDTDVVVTHFAQIHPNGLKEVVRYNTMGREPYEYQRPYGLDEVLKDGYIRFFLIHHLAYRTQMLIDNGYCQSEGVSYSDTEWSSIPLYYSATITFFDMVLYQYNFARPGQTMDPQVLFKSVGQLKRVTDSLIAFYNGYDKSSLSDTRLSFLRTYLSNRIRIVYKLMLLDMPRNMFDSSLFEAIYSEYDAFCKEAGIYVRLYPENKLLRIDMVKYWGRFHKRLPKSAECLNCVLDKVARYFYIRIFRR